jgi:prepilin-type N-terminal cleavage/methylation domain-containing protein
MGTFLFFSNPHGDKDHRKKRNVPNFGFTLLEMMLALALLSVGMVSLMELMQRAHRGVAGGEEVLTATQLAQRCLEQLRNVSYANLDTTSCSVPVAYSRFTLTKSVTTPYTNLKQISVRISWEVIGEVGETADVEMQTYRSNV